MSANHKRCLTPEKLERVYHSWLQPQFPLLFDGQFYPLAVGIFAELSAQLPVHITKTDLRIVLGWYASRQQYLKNIQQGLPRRDLAGNIVAEISDADKLGATQKLKELQKRFKKPARAAA